MNGTKKGLLLKVQTGGRLTIPNTYAKANEIEDGALVIVKISKAVVTAEMEEKEG